MGLDQNIFRKYTPKSVIDKTIQNLDFKEADFEDMFYWRKDYKLHEFFCESVEVENCEYVELSRELLIDFLSFLIDSDKTPMKEFEEESLDYTKEIAFMTDLIKKYDDEEFVYYYWAWW